MSLRDAYPAFVIGERAIFYYQSVYDQLVSNEVIMQSQDCYALGVLALNLSLVEQATNDISKNGMSITMQGDRNEVTKANPAINVLKESQAQVKHYFKEFRMSPGSRGKELVISKTESDGFDDI